MNVDYLSDRSILTITSKTSYESELYRSIQEALHLV